MNYLDGVTTELEFPELDPQTTACLRLWAAKMIIHAKDYADGVASEGKNRVRDSGVRNTTFISENYARAKRWIFDDLDCPGSFIWVCTMFNIDPEHARNRITRRWRENTTLGKRKEPKEPKAPESNSSDEDEDDVPTQIKVPHVPASLKPKQQKPSGVRTRARKDTNVPAHPGNDLGA